MDRDSLTSHWAGLLSVAAAAAGWFLRRRLGAGKASPPDGPPAGDRGSWIGRRLNLEQENSRLREDNRGMEQSIARREARWTTERAEMQVQIDDLLDRLERLTRTTEAATKAHDDGLLVASEPPSTAPTPPSATSSPSSRKSRPSPANP